MRTETLGEKGFESLRSSTHREAKTVPTVRDPLDRCTVIPSVNTSLRCPHGDSLSRSTLCSSVQSTALENLDSAWRAA
jgi:hypothetical protein